MDNIERVELLPYHKMGAYKWDTMGDEYKLQGVEAPPRETLDRIQAIIESYGQPVTFSK